MLTLLNPKHFPYFSQSAPPGVSWGQFVQPVSIPTFTCIICENWFPIGPAVLPDFPGLWIVDPINHPPPQFRRGVSWGEPVSIPRWIHRRVPNMVPIGPSDWQHSQTLICDPLKPPEMPPMVLRGELYSAYVDSQTNPQICTKFGANQSRRLTASLNIWNVTP